MNVSPGIAILLLCLNATVLTAQVHRVEDNPIPQIPKVLKPEEVIRADTMQHPVNMLVDSLPGGSRITDYPYTAVQDSNYFRALRIKMSPKTRLAIDAAKAWSNLAILRRSLQESPWQTALRNMTIRQELLRADPVESVNRQLTIERAMDAGLYRPNSTQNLSATFEQIGTVLGLTEDVSPTLQYEVKQSSAVVIVVYSTAASVVATLLKKVQQPGQYSVTWNLRNDAGKELADGDYVLEARVGESIFFRKHVVIGSRP